MSGRREQRRVLFSGHVQGVGFRYTTDRLAGGRPLDGHVRNLEDGRVELVVEGSPSEIDGLLEAIREHFGANIHGEATDRHPAAGLHQGFEIRR